GRTARRRTARGRVWGAPRWRKKVSWGGWGVSFSARDPPVEDLCGFRSDHGIRGEIAAPADAVGADDAIAADAGPRQDRRVHADPCPFADHDGLAGLVRLLHHGHFAVGEIVLVVADEHVFRQQHVGLQTDRTRPSHKHEPADLILAPDLDARLEPVGFGAEFPTILLVDVVHQEAEIARGVDMAALTDRGDVADDDALGI